MPRIRSQSQSFNLYVSTGTATGSMSLTGDIRQLFRLTSIGGPEWTYERAPISVIGKLAPITRDTTDSPTVSVPFSYYVTDFENERNLGFNISASGTDSTTGPTTGAISDILSKVLGKDEKNYFILVTPEGVDAISRSGADPSDYVLGIGNANITNYSIEASVGDYPTASVTVEGLNLRGQFGTTGLTGGLVSNWLKTPAINPVDGTQIDAINTNFKLPAGSLGSPNKAFVLKPGDVTVQLSGASGLFADTALGQFNIQSFNVSFDLARDPIQSLGARYAKSRELTFPIDVNFTVEALAGDLKAADLRAHVCNNISNYTATIAMKKPDCNNAGGTAATIVLKGLSLQSEAFSVDVDDNQSVSLTWLGSIGSPTDTDNNVFFSGVVGY
jgi:hypothetical protein